MDSVARVCIPTLRSGVDRSAARALVEELRAKGFAYVAHPALVPEVLQRAKLAGRNLLTTCSLEERQRCAAPPSGFRGFYQYVGASGTGDQIQCFSMGAPVTSRKEALDLRGTYIL